MRTLPNHRRAQPRRLLSAKTALAICGVVLAVSVALPGRVEAQVRPALGRLEAPDDTVPTVVTADWLVVRFLSRSHRFASESEQQREDALWERARRRTGVVSALIFVWQDSAANSGLVRHNALLRMGATHSPVALQFLADLYDRLPAGADARLTVILGLSGLKAPDAGPLPELSYTKLEEASSSADSEERRAATYALGRIRTPRSRQMLVSHRARERDPRVLRFMDEVIASGSQ